MWYLSGKHECISLSVLSVAQVYLPAVAKYFKGFSLADHTLPTHPQPTWQKTVQSPISSTTWLMEIKEEGLRPTKNLRQRRPGQTNGQTYSLSIILGFTLTWFRCLHLPTYPHLHQIQLQHRNAFSNVTGSTNISASWETLNKPLICILPNLARVKSHWYYFHCFYFHCFYSSLSMVAQWNEPEWGLSNHRRQNTSSSSLRQYRFPTG